MVIKGTELYHISRSSDWYMGQKVTVGDKDNDFWRFSKNYSPQITVDQTRYDLLDFFSKFSGETFNVTKDNIVWLFNEFKNNIKECSLYIREQIFETIRAEIYHELPSRQKCLWLTDVEHLDYWKRSINCKDGSIITLSLEGNLFMADDSWLQANTLSSSEYERRARHYWAGDIGETAHLEYLFTGEAIVTGMQRIT